MRFKVKLLSINISVGLLSITCVVDWSISTTSVSDEKWREWGASRIQCGTKIGGDTLDWVFIDNTSFKNLPLWLKVLVQYVTRICRYYYFKFIVQHDTVNYSCPYSHKDCTAHSHIHLPISDEKNSDYATTRITINSPICWSLEDNSSNIITMQRHHSPCHPIY